MSRAVLLLAVVAPCLGLQPPMGKPTRAQPAPNRVDQPSISVARQQLTLIEGPLQVEIGGQQPVPWAQTLNRASTAASVVCAIDCTVFPLLLGMLPLLNIAGPSTELIHRAAPAVALYFVAPVGAAAVLSNAAQHRKLLVLLWGLSGVGCVLLANVHLPHVLLGQQVPAAIGHWLHVHHSAINVAGCALLLSSQRFARNLIEKCCEWC